jgi:hypothetical protein
MKVYIRKIGLVAHTILAKLNVHFIRFIILVVLAFLDTFFYYVSSKKNVSRKAKTTSFIKLRE